ncbi:MAG: hypothetical protein RMJ33_04960 [Saprospiraceae bacterium]|nr:hypothetical protein [Saprospiraceae bacterium]MDW8229170.1 hypothetical protein [Saprospiraceae bacterium]
MSYFCRRYGYGGMEGYFRGETMLSGIKAGMFRPDMVGPNKFGRYGVVAILALLAVVGAGCGGDKERIVEEKVAERLAEFRKRETEKCRQALLAEAERLVDSLLLAEAMREVADSLRQLRPPKPVKPPLLPPWDSLPVRPIFLDTTRQ